MSRPRSRGSALQLPSVSELPSFLIQYAYKTLEAYRALSPRAKVVVGLIALVYAAFTLVVIRLGPHGLLEWLAQFSTFFAQSSLGPLILILLLILLSFPPTIGYGTVITLCGLSFGSPLAAPGNSLGYAWFIAASGCLLGSVTAFLVCRMALDTHGADWSWVRKVRQGKEWKAMEKAVERKGWKMILLIRLCPFPFVYSNLFFASLRPEVIPVPFFVLATFATTPKLFLHVFIGAQTFEAIQAGRDGGEAPTHTSGWFRLFYVVGASALGAATSWYIYHETKKVLDSFIDEEEEEEGLVSGHDDMHRGDHSPQTRKSAARNEELERWDWSDDDDDARGTSSNGRAATR